MATESIREDFICHQCDQPFTIYGSTANGQVMCPSCGVLVAEVEEEEFDDDDLENGDQDDEEESDLHDADDADQEDD